MIEEQVRKIRERYDKGTRDIRDLQARAWESRAFLNGAQWMQWDDTFHRLLEAPRDPDRVRATVNRIGPDSRRIIAKLTTSPLQFEVIPSAPDDASRSAASLGESILSNVHREQDWEQIRREHAWATWEAGTAVIAVDWDSDNKDVRLSAVSLTEIATVPGTKNIRTAPWWIRATAVPPEEVQATYGLDKLPAADAKAQPTYLTRMGSAGRTFDQTPDLTLVLTYYERPNKNTKGRVVTVVGDEVVEETGWPFPWDDHLNLAVARTVEIPGRWAGHAICWDAIGVQTLYNASWSSIVEHMKLAGNARLLAPYGSIEQPDTLTDTPGELMEYHDVSGQPPRWLAPPQLPGWMLQEPERLRAEMDDIIGIHDVSRGAAPKNVESGLALAILEENDQTPTGAFARELANAWGQVGRMTLRLYEKRINSEREARVHTPGSPPMVTKWTGKSLMGQTHAMVPTESFSPMSRAAKMSFALQILDRFRDDIDMKAFAKIADMEQTFDLIEAVSPQVSKQRRENFYLAQGQPALVDKWDDDQVHLDELVNFMLSERYEHLDDKSKRLIELHKKAHETQLAEKTGEMEAAMRVSPTFGQVPDGNPQPLAPEQILPGGPEPGLAMASLGLPPDVGDQLISDQLGDDPLV
ncbi:MAG TPA: hypothetical protein VIG24_19310 [Acidimicrobiia bacterium]